MIHPKDLLFRLVLGIVILILVFIFIRCRKEEPQLRESSKDPLIHFVIDTNYEDTILLITDK